MRLEAVEKKRKKERRKGIKGGWISIVDSKYLKLRANRYGYIFVQD